MAGPSFCCNNLPIRKLGHDENLLGAFNVWPSPLANCEGWGQAVHRRAKGVGQECLPYTSGSKSLTCEAKIPTSRKISQKWGTRFELTPSFELSHS
jgi:hypothetical protein